MNQPDCPLCGSEAIRHLAAAHGRDFLECDRCRLIFVRPDQRPDAADERARYETHENDPADAGYREFLGRLFEPLVGKLPAGASGLDYGAGPGPTLSVMLEEAGFRMRIYDPYFAQDEGALRDRYDFVTCTETVEHFFDPAAEFERLDALLRPGGWLGVMTSVWLDREPFEDWWYARDPTHVCFYRPATLRWIAERFGWSLERPDPNVAFFRKP